jgi:hypothetical protein
MHALKRNLMDRKTMIREYKQRRRPMGVFQVRNLATGKVFVGASPDLPAMLNRQRAQLRLGMHPNRALQADWTAQGPEAFAFEILDTLSHADRPDADPATDLRLLEHMWLEKLAPHGERGYNPVPRTVG